MGPCVPSTTEKAAPRQSHLVRARIRGNHVATLAVFVILRTEHFSQFRSPRCILATLQNRSQKGRHQSSANAPRPIASTRKSNHDGSNQNDSAKKDAPTASEGAVASHCFVGFVACEAPACPRLISSTVAANGELVTKVFIEFHCGFLIGLLIRAVKGYILFRLSCLIRRASGTGPRTTPGHMRHTSRRSPV